MSFRPGTSSLTSLLRLAAPLVTIQVGMMLMGVADTVMVGHVSAQALAAVALGNLYHFTLFIFGLGVLLVLDPVVAQAVGAGDDVGIARGVQRGLLLSIGLTVFIAFTLLPADWVFRMLDQPPEVIPLASGYVLRMIPGIVPFLVFAVLRQTLQAMHRTWTIVLSLVAANAGNILLNWVLIFGHWGAPPMGVIGSAWATTANRWILLLALLLLDWRQLRPYLRPFRPESFAAAPLWRMLLLGLPIGTQVFLEFAAFGLIAILMGWLGTIQVAGHQVALNLASLTFMVPLGTGAAAAVLVGNAVGRNDPDGARAAARSALLCGGAFMGGAALLFLLLPGTLAGFYTRDPAVLAIAATLIPIAGLFQVFDGLQAVGAGVLRGLGDTRAPMLINIMGFWLIGLPVSLVFGFTLKMGPVGLWWGLVAGLAAVAGLLLVRIRHRFRAGVERVLIDQVPAPEPP